MGTIIYPTRRPRTPAHRGNPAGLIEQLMLAVLAGFLIFGLAAALTFFGTRLWYAGRILPGVTVRGIPVGGLSPHAAAIELVMKLNYPLAGKIVLRDGDKMWVAAPGELGLSIDPEASAQAAFRVGRSGFLTTRARDQIAAAYSGEDVAPVLVYDQGAAFRYLQNLARENRPPRPRRRPDPQRVRGGDDPRSARPPAGYPQHPGPHRRADANSGRRRAQALH